MTAVHRMLGSRPRVALEMLLGLLMLPLSAVPIFLFLTHTPDGYLMLLRGRYALLPPATAKLQPEVAAYVHDQFNRVPIDGVPVLVYYGISHAGAESPSARFVVSQPHFAQQMRALQTAGFHAVSVEDVAHYLHTGDAAALPSRPVLITFDDGRTDAMIQADPVLKSTGMRAAMFVIGKAASSSSFYYADWGELRGYASSGRWELEDHTNDLHVSIDDVKGLLPTSGLVRKEAGETTAAFEQRIGADIDADQRLLAGKANSNAVGFAYPYGDWGQHARTPDVPSAVQRVLRARFQIAFDQDRQAGWRFALAGDDVMHVHRLEVENWTGVQLIQRLVAAAKLSKTTYRERGLDLRIDRKRLVAAASSASCTPVRAEPVESLATSTKDIALSFDGGPSPYTPQVLDVLRDFHAHATFFVLGQNVPGRSRLLGRMLISGDEIGNGTWTGSHAAAIGDSALEQELRRTDAEIEAAVPFRPCLTRPPYREGVDRMARLGLGLNLTTALWSIDPRDRALRSPAEIARRVVSQARPGSIVILHDGGNDRWATVQALPRILTALERRGYHVMSISQLLAQRQPAQAPRGKKR